MAAVGEDQLFNDVKDNPFITPANAAKRRLIKYSQASSMSSPQSTTVTKTPTDNMQAAVKRRLKKLQEQDQTNENS